MRSTLLDVFWLRRTLEADREKPTLLMHRTMLKRWAGTVVWSCPSSTTDIALPLAPGAAPSSYLGRPACMLHLWDAAHGMVSHVSHIGGMDGPHPFA